jgi:universal stress protein E
MKRFGKILVYANMLAARQPALDRGVKLAEFFGSELKIVDIFDAPSDPLHRPMRNAVEIEKIDKLESLCEKLFHLDLDFTFELLRGRPFLEIVREVVHTGFQLVIKTASVSDPTEVLGMMGAVDMRLVRNCPCPILLEAPNGSAGWHRILVAIDPYSNDPELNNSMLEIASAMSRIDGGKVHVIGAWNIKNESFLSRKLDTEGLNQYRTEVETHAQKRFNSLLRDSALQLPSEQVHFTKGEPSKVILNCVAVLKPDILVMGTVADSDTTGMLIGNTADLVLRQVNCSVLAIKPGGLFRA